MDTLRLQAPSLLEYFAALVADDAHFSQFEAAVAVAQDEDPRLDVQGVLAQVDDLADRLKRRIAADAAPLARLRYLNRYFFHELGFAGNVNDYYCAENSYLHRVLATRRGIPITLALVYIEIAQQIGLDARGVSFPGHFLVKVKMPQGEVIIDPFNGRSLSRDELEDRLAPYKQQQGLTGNLDVPLGLFLQSATARAVLARMLRNLKEIHRTAQDWARLLAVLERLVVLLPDDWDERRDRGLVYAELGDAVSACHDLATYLRHRPQAEDARAIGERLEQLRGDGSGRTH
ncbi:MAG TPA: tetratricopeptide repeat protein [Burkholderiaceae bacterium]|nr:tetratricopeptide repeat protein [Burkholderiaceae bacterium]